MTVMPWARKIGRIAGIDVYVHATFMLLVAFVGLVAYRAKGSLAAAAVEVAFVLVIFAVVVLHELGHALAARRYGIATRDITLLPIGGLARLEKMPERPAQELVVAIAGPLVNVVIAAVLAVGFTVAGAWPRALPPDSLAWPFLFKLFAANVALAVFNMIPAFPMDGGRVLRALLAMRYDRVRATRIAAGVGQVFALLIGLVGLVGNPFLILIAIFVWVGAARETIAEETKSFLDGLRVRDVMITDFRTLAPWDTLADAVALTLAGAQTDFPVVEDARVIGVLTRQRLVSALADRPREDRVMAVMLEQFPVASPLDPVEQAIAQFQGAMSPAMPVIDGGTLVGLVTLENLGEYVAFQNAIRSRR
jgi:Zn-dependent protease/CBS domain-containing protein